MNMETNCQFKGAPQRISRELKNSLLDNITDGRPDQIFCNIIGQLSRSESSYGTQDINHQLVILLYHQGAILLYHHHQKISSSTTRR